jgi:hypothetical protein
LPDAIISDQKSQFGQILGGPGMENVGLFVLIWDFTASWYIVCPFGNFGII